MPWKLGRGRQKEPALTQPTTPIAPNVGWVKRSATQHPTATRIRLGHGEWQAFQSRAFSLTSRNRRRMSCGKEGPPQVTSATGSFKTRTPMPARASTG